MSHQSDVDIVIKDGKTNVLVVRIIIEGTNKLTSIVMNGELCTLR